MPGAQIPKARPTRGATRRAPRRMTRPTDLDAETIARRDELDWLENSDLDANDADLRSILDAAHADDLGDRYN